MWPKGSGLPKCQQSLPGPICIYIYNCLWPIFAICKCRPHVQYANKPHSPAIPGLKPVFRPRCWSDAKGRECKRGWRLHRSPPSSPVWAGWPWRSRTPGEAPSRTRSGDPPFSVCGPGSSSLCGSDPGVKKRSLGGCRRRTGLELELEMEMELRWLSLLTGSSSGLSDRGSYIHWCRPTEL